MTRYDDTTTATANAVRPLLRYDADLIDCFRDDDDTIYLILRCADDTELMFKLIE